MEIKMAPVSSVKNNGDLKVAVLAGGVGEERPVSLQSGGCVAKAIEAAGIDVILCDVSPDRLDILDDSGIDVFFIALHGRFGEDGQLQQILEKRSLCFTGSDSNASRIAFDKAETKKVFNQAGILTPDSIVFAPDNKEMVMRFLSQTGDKFVVKPCQQGSSVGVSIADSAADAFSQAQQCFEKFGNCLIEKFIAGKELTVGILNGQPLPIIEIRPRNSFYDFDAKYIDDKTEYLFDTISDARLVKKIQQQALKCFDALGCRQIARVDFMLDKTGDAYAIEVNTIPGFTSHSLLPKAACKSGLDMSGLCLSIINNAVEDAVENK